MRILVWFRGKDLRLRDNEALSAASQDGEAFLAYVASEQAVSAVAYEKAPARTRYLLAAVDALSADIERSGGQLLVLHGEPELVLPAFVDRHGIDLVYTQRIGFPAERAIIAELERLLPGKIRQFGGETLIAPQTIRTAQGEPYSVFTPFSRAAKKSLTLAEPLPKPARWARPSKGMRAEHRPLPKPGALGIADTKALPEPGEAGAQRRLRTFISEHACSYETGRDALARDGTSRLSADLRFGTVSPRQAWHAVEAKVPAGSARERFLTQLLWREFAYSTLWDRPWVLVSPFQRKFERFPWREPNDDFLAWTEGRTGYPIVDAAARQLLCEGYVHNRARMIAASFLTKDLLIDFRHGERHYLRYLEDGDLAQNDMGWQWASGTGCDAQPYFRIFNPVSQGERFDPDGDYVRRYVPELARVPAKYIHHPWEASASELRACSVRLGVNYPLPIVDHASARKRFLMRAAEFFGK